MSVLPGCSNLGGLLREAAKLGNNGGVGYLTDDGSCRFDSYGGLLAKATARMGALRERGLRPNDKLILASGTNESFIVTFWGCLLGGIVPVPMAGPPASSAASSPAVARLQSVSATLEGPRILLSQPPPPEWGLHPDQILVEADLASPSSTAVDPVTPRAENTAFIQFSSGSTARPKGVVLSHANVMANLRAIAEGLALTPDDVGVNWLPLHHDMGLVGFHLASTFVAARQYHLETIAFVRRPLLWLNLLTRYKATITAGPNFSQSLVLSRLEVNKDANWDLSSVRLIMNGAEPISVQLMQQFLKALAQYGLREQAMFPCYGLAEATLAVCFPPLGEPPRIETLDRDELQKSRRAAPAADPRNGIRFVSEGFPVRGCVVRIVDEQDRALPECAVGHIQIRGDNVTKGYCRTSEATPDATDLFADGWMRTGDLGFLAGGRLCVTGRAKDILIINGQNLYAHDIEDAAQQVEGVAPGRVAACGCYDPVEEREKLVIFLATGDPKGDARRFQQVRRRIQSVIGVRPDAMAPLPSAGFPKTTSGKLQRFVLRERFERGEFAEPVRQMKEWMEALPPDPSRQMPTTTTEILLQREWCAALGLAESEVGIQDRFADLGGRSIHAAIIIARMESRLGVALHSSELATRDTIAEIAAYIDRSARTRSGSKLRYFRG